MKIVTLNVNGIRSAAKKGLFDWLKKEAADIVCLQEIRAQAEHLTQPPYQGEEYHCFYRPAQKKGYGGVAIYTLKKPDRVIDQLGWDVADQEGRYLQVDFGELSVVSIYMPSGTSGEARQIQKFDFMTQYGALLAKRDPARAWIICGDWNIAHQKIDLKNWRGNQKNSGFLPKERAWLDHIFNEVGLIDAFRVVNQAPEQYTWWSNRGRAWANNVGWRIDYQVVTTHLAAKIKHAAIYKENRFSDHAPLIIEYDI